MSEIRVFAFLPESPLFFGSGRDFSPNASTWDEGMLLPSPSTIFGALSASLFEELKGDILDRRRRILEKMPKFVPIILKVDSRKLVGAGELEGTVYLPAPPLIKGGEPMLPVVREDDRFVFLKPTVTGKWMPVRELLTLLERIKIEVVDGRHQVGSDGEGWELLNDLIDPESALATSYSVGLKIDPERGTAETGMLYRIRTVSPKIELGGSSFQLGFLAIGGDEGWEPTKWVFLGGERRVAKVVRVNSDVQGLDRALITDEKGRDSRLGLLITPGIYLKGSNGHLFRDIYTGRCSRCCGLVYGTLTPIGVIRHINIPMSIRCGRDNVIRAVFRAVSEGSLLWLQGNLPESFAHEIGFGMMLRVEGGINDL